MAQTLRTFDGIQVTFTIKMEDMHCYVVTYWVSDFHLEKIHEIGECSSKPLWYNVTLSAFSWHSLGIGIVFVTKPHCTWFVIILEMYQLFSVGFKRQLLLSHITIHTLSLYYSLKISWTSKQDFWPFQKQILSHRATTFSNNLFPTCKIYRYKSH